MFWNDLQGKSGGVFKRLTGVRRATFEKMVEAVREHTILNRKHPTRGANLRKPPRKTRC